MSKFKPHKGTLKRIRVTKSGKVKGRVANGSHLRSGKSGEQMRNLARARYLTNYGIRKKLTKLLGRPIKAVKTKSEKAKAAAARAEKAAA